MSVTFTVTITDEEAYAIIDAGWAHTRTGPTDLREGHRKIMQEVQAARNNRLMELFDARTDNSKPV
jgi:hypothetical protein